MSERSKRLAAIDAMAERCIEEFEAGTQDQPCSHWNAMKAMPGFDDWEEVTADRSNRRIEMYGIPNGICVPFPTRAEKAALKNRVDEILQRVHAAKAH